MQTSDIYSEKIITREEITIALQKFLENGGTIKTFPPQIVVAKRYIPIPLSAYEELGDLSFV